MTLDDINVIHAFCMTNNWTQIVMAETYVDIVIGPGRFCIEKRPQYCDRGRFTVKAFTSDPSKFYIDYTDGFPRYFFHLETLLSELKAYIDFNKEKLIKK